MIQDAMKNQAVTTVVFDFDGTIADSLVSLVGIYNTVLAPLFDTRPVDPSQQERLRSRHPRELMREFGVTWRKLPRMVVRARKELNRRIPKLSTQDGIGEVLHELKERDFTLGILSSNSTKNVNLFIETHQMESLFDFIYTGKHLLGKHRIIRSMLRHHHLHAPNVLYVGDEVRDIEAGRKIGVKTAGVTWGFNSKDALQKAAPDFLIERPRQLAEML